MTYAILERANNGRIDFAGITGDPRQTPKVRLGIKKSQSNTFEKPAFRAGKLMGGVSVHVGLAGEDFVILIGGSELRPFVGIRQPLIQVPIVHFPFSDEKIKVTHR